jgi:hypothetical protein
MPRLHGRRAAPVSALVVLVWAAACGAPPETPGTFIQTSAAWAQGSGDCADRANLASLEAVLWVGGHADCQLTVDATTLTASGNCDALQPGIERPLTVAYYLPTSDPEIPDILALALGFADLTEEALEGSDGNVDVALGEGAGMLVHTEAQAANLEQLTREEAAEATPEQLAEDWAGFRYFQQPGRLDTDDDNCPNLVEACDGNLGVAGNTDC